MISQNLTAMVTIKRMLYPRSGFENGGWCILACKIKEVLDGEPYDDDEIVVKGNVFSADYGQTYRFSGSLVEEDKYGPSYTVATFTKEMDLNDKDQQRTYLESLAAASVVDALYAALSDPYTALLNKDANALMSAKGIGKKKAWDLITKFHADLANAKAYAVLGQYGLSVASIATLIKKFSSVEECIATIETNPYLMITEVDGIGWARADAIAKAKGISHDSPLRMEAAVQHVLSNSSTRGNTWATPTDLLYDTFNLMGFTDMSDIVLQEKFRQVLYTLHDHGILWWNEEKTMLALARLRKLEENIAKELIRISDAGPSAHNRDYSLGALKQIENEQGWSFTEEQLGAITMALQNNVSIITGGAGTGKSSAVAGVLKASHNSNFAQCALSGRAAARLTEVTGETGQTIHRLLGYQGGYFMNNKDNPLDYDIIILDEVSMVGADIFYALLQAIPCGSKLIMLGDDGQLESIGLCNVFADMLKSDIVPVSRLTKIHRQAARSAIITESVKVRQQEQLFQLGWVGQEVRGELQDLELDIYSDSIVSADILIEHYQSLLAQGLSPHEIQVVVPMRARGSLASFALNKQIQALVNPLGQGIEVSTLVGKSKQTYRLSQGDRVIVTKNTYDSVMAEDSDVTCPVYNGDRGVIAEVDHSHMVVKFDLWGEIYLSKEQMNNIELGYALTCHKLQGSEAPYVIVGLDDSGFMLATKEWLYTALTRAKKRCILCAQSKAVTYAISHSNIPIKQTMLAGLLREISKKGYHGEKEAKRTDLGKTLFDT